MKHFGILVLISLSLWACQSTTAPSEPHPLDQVQTNKDANVDQKITLYDLSWMQGIWIDSTSFLGQKVIENWTLKNDTLIGLRGTINKLDTVYSQTSKIFIANNSPVYLLEPEGSSFVSFKLKEFAPKQITFGNIANPAPTELTYTQNGLHLDLSFTILTPAGERKFKHHFLPLVSE
ncbi:MAG: hypothetical protein N4A35_00385 [Flavobacteriales bacterium]|jgi:hypothetical protein|nr:hypothetical protein [Flavobacteriales bacterium]